MLISEEKLSINEVVSFIGVDKRTAMGWCKDRKLRAKKNTRGQWEISVMSLANFLYYNPRFKQHFIQSTPNKTKTVLAKKYILDKLAVCPPIYTKQDIADIFDVSLDTVIAWIKYGILQPINKRSTNRACLFTDKSIGGFLHRHPRYIPLYEKYKEEHK